MCLEGGKLVAQGVHRSIWCNSGDQAWVRTDTIEIGRTLQSPGEGKGKRRRGGATPAPSTATRLACTCKAADRPADTTRLRDCSGAYCFLPSWRPEKVDSRQDIVHFVDH